jgi:hypothetical protein
LTEAIPAYRAVRKELPHFNVGEFYGGDQEWFSDPWMFRGGCGAVTACDLCIFLAKHYGMRALYPFDPDDVKKEDYLSFGERMRVFLSPRATGINTTQIYIDGLNDYFDSVGERPLRLEGVSGSEDVETAVSLVRDQIDRGFPVPYLMLMHRDKKLKDYMWHWFLLNAYEETEKSFLVKVVTYGEEVWFDLRHLWRTGRRMKGGFVRILR